MATGFGVQSSGFAWGPGSRVQSTGHVVLALGYGVQGPGFRAQGTVVQALGFQGLRTHSAWSPVRRWPTGWREKSPAAPESCQQEGRVTGQQVYYPPLQPDTTPLQSYTTPLQPDTTPLQSCTTPLQSYTTPLQPDTTPLQPDTTLL